MITEARGGHGCLREFIEAILRARRRDRAPPASTSALPEVAR
jgi:3-deoxy-D-manno-octulosonate 8-phosphate phosphatase KdsC-like HAD superfamily phosphatase